MSYTCSIGNVIPKKIRPGGSNPRAWILARICVAALCVAMFSFLMGCESHEEKQARLAQIVLASTGDESSQAAQELEDPALLIKVATEAKEKWARYHATKKITDQDILERIARKDASKSVREAAVLKLTNQALLGKIALEEEDSQVRKAAVEALRDQSLLAEVAITVHDYTAAPLAAEKVTDQALLGKIVLEGRISQARQKAAEKLTDQQVLFRIAKGEKDHKVRSIALDNLSDPKLLAEARAWHFPDDTRKMTDQSLLEKIALQSDNAKVARAAVEKLTNKKLLVDMATRMDLNRLVSSAAYERLGPNYRTILAPWLNPHETSKVRDPYTLKNIGLEASDAHVREAAVKSLINGRFRNARGRSATQADLLRQDQEFLIEVALEDKDEDVRKAAMQGLTDQRLLAKIAIEDESWKTREAAAKAITDPALRKEVGKWFYPEETRKVRDQDLLFKIAVEAPGSRVRLAAMESIRDQSLLANIAIESQDIVLQRAAVRSLKDQNLLAKVALTSKAPWEGLVNARVLAIQSITDQTILEKIALQDENWCNAFSQWDRIRSGSQEASQEEAQGQDWQSKDSRCAFVHASFMMNDPQVLHQIIRDFPGSQAKYAKLKLALLDWGQPQLMYKITILRPSRTYEVTTKYTMTMGSATVTQPVGGFSLDKVFGEDVTLAVFKGAKKIGTWKDKTMFPQKVSGQPIIQGLEIDPQKVIAHVQKLSYSG